MSDRTTDGPAARTGDSAAATGPSTTGTTATGPTTNPAGSLARRVVVTVSFLVCVVGSMVGVGVFGGTPISEASGGLLDTDTTHLAPASPAFSVWTLIYIALGAYTIWQWWDRSDSRRIGWLVAASLLLNAAWILTVQAGWVWGSVAVIVVLLAVLAAAFRQLLMARPRSLIEAAVADGTVGLYLGWVSVATCANIAAALAGAGFTGGGYPEVWAAVVLAVVAAIGVALAVVGRGRLAPAATLVWGLAWIAVARTDEPASQLTMIAAVTAAVIVAVATVVTRLRAGLRAGPGAA